MVTACEATQRTAELVFPDSSGPCKAMCFGVRGGRLADLAQGLPSSGGRQCLGVMDPTGQTPSLTTLKTAVAHFRNATGRETPIRLFFPQFVLGLLFLLCSLGSSMPGFGLR